MSKNKATTVTVIFAVMLAGLDFCLWKVNLNAFVVLTGALALFGYWQLSKGFLGWLLHNEEPLALPEVHAEPVDLDEGFTATFDEIMAEMEAERREAGA